MWLGLYLIAFSSWFMGHFGESMFNDASETLACFFWILKTISFFCIPIITIAYGINLIINN